MKKADAWFHASAFGIKFGLNVRLIFLHFAVSLFDNKEGGCACARKNNGGRCAYDDNFNGVVFPGT